MEYEGISPSGRFEKIYTIGGEFQDILYRILEDGIQESLILYFEVTSF